MSNPKPFLLGLAPALIVDEPIGFGPFTLSPVEQCDNGDLLALAQRFSKERGANRSLQAVITCPELPSELITTIWPLFVFACVSFTRRAVVASRRIHPEHFHLIP